MSEQMNRNKRKRQVSAVVIVIVVLLVLLLILAILIAVRLLRDQPQEDADTRPEVRGTVVTQDNAEELILDGSEVPDGHYDVSMSIDWHFKDGVTEDAQIANKTTNTRTVYFDLMTESTEEVVYSSPYIPVGESMRGFTLDKELAPGTYDMIVRYYLVDDNNVEVSNVSVGVTIYVE